MQTYANLIPGGTAVFGLFFLIITFCIIYKKIKDTQIFQDIFNSYRYFKSKKIEELEKNLKSPFLQTQDINAFQSDYITAILQKDLKVDVNNLPTLRFLRNLENPPLAVSLYKNCNSLLRFNKEDQYFELIKPITLEEAKKSEKIGVGIFFTSGIFAYLFLIYMLYCVDTGINLKENISFGIAWGMLNLIIMLAIIFIACRILKFFMRPSNALKLLGLPKKSLDTSIEGNQPEKN